MSNQSGEAVLHYQARPPNNDLKEVIDDHLETLLRVYPDRYRSTYGPLHPRIRDIFEAYLRCGDPHYGFLRLKCSNPNCTSKTEIELPYSCKSRGLCPSCGQKRALAWAERMVDEVLPNVP